MLSEYVLQYLIRDRHTLTTELPPSRQNSLLLSNSCDSLLGTHVCANTVPTASAPASPSLVSLIS